MRAHDAELRAVKDAHEAELRAVKDEHEAELRAVEDAHEAELRAVKDVHEAELRAVKDAHDADMRAHDAELRAVKDAHDAELRAAKEDASQRIDAVVCATEMIEMVAYVADDLVVADSDVDALRAELSRLRRDAEPEVVSAEVEMVAVIERANRNVLDRSKRARSAATVADIVAARSRLRQAHAGHAGHADAVLSARDAVLSAREAAMDLLPDAGDLAAAVARCDVAERGVIGAEAKLASAEDRRRVVKAALSRTAVRDSGGGPAGDAGKDPGGHAPSLDPVGDPVGDPERFERRLADARDSVVRAEERRRASTARAIGRVVDAVLWSADLSEVAPRMLSALSDLRRERATEWSPDELLEIAEAPKTDFGSGCLAECLASRWDALVKFRAMAMAMATATATATASHSGPSSRERWRGHSNNRRWQ